MDVYAVNIADLTSLEQIGPPSITGLLLGDYVTSDSPVVITNKQKWGSAAVVLDGPAAGEPDRTEALITLLQKHIGPRHLKRHVRCYKRGPNGGWKGIRP